MAEEKRQKFNEFTLQWEDAPEPLIAPSPTDQRILAAPPHKDPLPELVARVVNHVGDEAGINVEKHVGPSLQGDPLPGETPLAYIPEVDDTPEVLNPGIPEQHKDVPPPNDPIIEAMPDVKPADYGPYPGLDVHDYTKSLEERDKAVEKNVHVTDLPPVDYPELGAPLTDEVTEEKPKRKSTKKTEEKAEDNG